MSEAARIEALEKELLELKNVLEEKLKGMNNGNDAESKVLLPRYTNPAFVLEKETNFDVWLKVTSSELKSFNFDYIIKVNGEKPEDVTEEHQKRVAWVWSYVLGRVSSEFKKLICDEELPWKMIAKLQDLKEPKMNSARYAAKRAWNSITF